MKRVNLPESPPLSLLDLVMPLKLINNITIGLSIKVSIFLVELFVLIFSFYFVDDRGGPPDDISLNHLIGSIELNSTVGSHYTILVLIVMDSGGPVWPLV